MQGARARYARRRERTRLPRSCPARGTTSHPAERASRAPLDGVTGSQGRGVGAAGQATPPAAQRRLPLPQPPYSRDERSCTAASRLSSVRSRWP